MFHTFDEFFAPGRRHTDEERQRLALTRADVGDGDPGSGPIDLASGRVTIRVPQGPPSPADEAPSRPEDPDP
ncbi:DUF6191 domain-containing protein [Streptomyces sp. NPDC002867]